MPRVLFVSHSASLDGATKVLANLLSAFEKDAIQPLAIFPEDGPILRMVEKAGVPYRIIDVGHLGWELHHVPLLQLLFREEKAECIHANTTVSYPAVLAARLAGIPAVWHIHEMLSHRQHYPCGAVDEKMLPELIKSSDRICVASEAGKNAFVNYWSHPQIDVEKKMQVIHNGVTLPEAAPPLGRAEFVISAIGNFVPLKGFEYLIEAFADLVRDYPQARLQIVGNIFPSYFFKLYTMADNLGVGDKVSFHTETAEIEEIFLKSHVIACSSIIETFPMVVLEALSYGKPVVATRVGGIPELVRDKDTGLLVPPQDASALAEAFKFCLENWDEALQMGRQGRRLVSEKFTLAGQAQKFLSVYEDLVRNEQDAQNTASGLNELKGILYDHLVSESEKLHQLQKSLEEQRMLISANRETINNVIADIRTLEGVVANVLNKWPIRTMQTLKRALLPKGREEH